MKKIKIQDMDIIHTGMDYRISARKEIQLPLKNCEIIAFI